MFHLLKKEGFLACIIVMPSVYPPGNERIYVVDALRGFAVMAIMLLHFLEHFIYNSYPVASSPMMEAANQQFKEVFFFLFAGKQEKKDLLELLVGRFHHWGRSHGIGIVDEMFKKMQQHDRHYGKAAQSVHHVNAFVAGGIYGRHDNNTCQEAFFFQQMEHTLQQCHLPLKPRRVFSLHITEN